MKSQSITAKSRTWMMAFQLLVIAATMLCAGPAAAWDAGPPECAHSPCTGGMRSASIPDTKPKWANSNIPGRLADCPPGYTNNGIAGCGRGMDSKPSGGSSLANCPSSYTNMGTYCGTPKWYDPLGVGRTTSVSCGRGEFVGAFARCYKECPSGYRNDGEFCTRDVSLLGPSNFICRPGERRGGGLIANKCFPSTPTNPGPCDADREEYGVSGASLCFTKCPPNSSRSAISTCVHSIRFGGNTHLYVVLNALSILQRASGDAVAQAAYARMMAPSCRKEWEQGLWDGDGDTFIDSPGGNTGGTHFYNGGGKDEQGNPTSVKTYTFLGKEQNKSGNARDNAKSHLTAAGSLQTDAQCHELGLALHYMTDMTMPMHATGFSGGGLPLYLHPTFESYVPFVQGNYPAEAPWDQRWKGQAPDNVLDQASIRSGSLAPALMKTMAYDGTICTMTAETHGAGAIAAGAGAGLLLGPGGAIAGGVIASGAYTGTCFVNDPNVNAHIGIALRDGYQSTASYVHAAFRAAQGLPAEAQQAQALAPVTAQPQGPLLTAAAVAGTYRYAPMQNGWHEGTISGTGTALRWTNTAGATWALTADYANNVLRTGADNPYQQNGPRDFSLVRNAAGEVTAFNFGASPNVYAKLAAAAAASVAPLAPATPAGPKRWVNVDTNGVMSAVAVQRDGSILGVGTDHQLWLRANLNAPWQLLPGTGTVKGVAVMPDGTIMGISLDNRIYTRTKLTGPWSPTPDNGGRVSAAAVLPDGKILGVGMDGNLWTQPNLSGAWSGVASSCCVTAVAVLPNGSVAGVGTDRQVYLRATLTTPWAVVPGSASVTAVTAIPGGTTLLGVGLDGHLYTW